MSTIESKSLLAASYGPALIPVIDLTEAADANKGKKVTIDLIKSYIEANFRAKVYHARPSGNQTYSFTNSGYSVLNTDHIFILEFQSTNVSDNPTLNVSSLGALNLKVFDETLGSPDYRNFLAGEIEAQRHYIIGYEDTGGGFWKVLNHKIENPKILLAEKGATNGVASLDSNGKIPEAQMPSLAITDIFPVNDTSIANFCANTAGGLQIQKGDVIILNGATPTEYYMFLGGDPGDSNDYIKTSISLVDWASLQNVPTASVGTAGIVDLINDLTNTSITKALTAAQGKALQDTKENKLVVDGSFTNLGDGSTAIDLDTTSQWKKVIKRTLDQNVTNLISFSNGVEGQDYLIKIATGNNSYTNIGFAASVKTKDGIDLLIPDNGGTHLYYIDFDGTDYWVEVVYEEV